MPKATSFAQNSHFAMIVAPPDINFSPSSQKDSFVILTEKLQYCKKFIHYFGVREK